MSGAVAGVVLAWLLPSMLGPAIAAHALRLRDSPRLSDAVLGAGSLALYLASAPSFYVNLHAVRSNLPQAPLNAAAWALVGALCAGLVSALGEARAHGGRWRLLAGALGGLLAGWILPALSQALGQCFAHCYMHEGLLGDLALTGGAALRAIGVLAEGPARLLLGWDPNASVPTAAMAISAGLWALAGLVVGAATSALSRHATGLTEETVERRTERA